MSNNDRQVWVGCLACYNNGCLTGEWLDPQAGTEWTCPVAYSHEETWVFDHEGFHSMFGECSPDQAAACDEVLTKVEDMFSWCDYAVEAFIAWLDNQGLSYADVDLSDFEEQFAGVFEDEAEYAQQEADAMHSRDWDSEWPLNCIDWEKAGRELVYGGDIWTHRYSYGTTFIFRNY